MLHSGRLKVLASKISLGQTHQLIRLERERVKKSFITLTPRSRAAKTVYDCTAVSHFNQSKPEHTRVEPLPRSYPTRVDVADSDKHVSLQHDATTLSIIRANVAHSKCYYLECHYDGCRGTCNTTTVKKFYGPSPRAPPTGMTKFSR